jgi:cupin 2 domain-containing protein
MIPSVRNLFQSIPTNLPQELFETLLETEGFRLERIVSRGHATPPGDWHEQARDEWVILLRGRAALQFESVPDPVVLSVGDHILIPAQCRHRVKWTEPNAATVWLALHYSR